MFLHGEPAPAAGSTTRWRSACTAIRRRSEKLEQTRRVLERRRPRAPVGCRDAVLIAIGEDQVLMVDLKRIHAIREPHPNADLTARDALPAGLNLEHDTPVDEARARRRARCMII